MEMPDWKTLEKWLKDPNMRDVAVASIVSTYVAFNADDIKRTFGKFPAAISARLSQDNSLLKQILGLGEENTPWEDRIEAMKEYEKDLKYYEKAQALSDEQWNDLQQRVRLENEFYRIAQSWYGVYGPLTVQQLEQFAREHGAYLGHPTRPGDKYSDWAVTVEDRRLYNARDNLPEKPENIKGFEHWLRGATPKDTAMMTMIAFIVALRPELIPESMKGMGEIVKGIGEIVPL